MYPKNNGYYPLPKVLCSLVQLCPTLTPWTIACQSASLPRLRDSPGKNTGVGFHSLLQGIFPNPGIKPRSLTFQADSLPPEPPGKPTQECILEELGLKSEKAKLQNV